MSFPALSPQGRSAKDAPKAPSESDIELGFDAKENSLTENGSLPALLCHVPQLAKDADEAPDPDTDMEEGAELGVDAGDVDLLSPIPDLHIMQSNTAAIKVQPNRPAALLAVAR